MALARLDIWLQTQEVEVGMELEDKFRSFLDVFLIAHEAAQLKELGGNPVSVEVDAVERTVQASVLIRSGEHDQLVLNALGEEVTEFLREHRLAATPFGPPPMNLRREVFEASEFDLVEARTNILRQLESGDKTRSELASHVDLPPSVYELLVGFLAHRGDIDVEMIDSTPPDVRFGLPGDSNGS